MTIEKMPVLFVSHGSPMLAIDSENGNALTEWGDSLPKPKAILVFSAHWETDILAFGQTSDHHNLVYDFGGFPKALYEIQYPAPGAANLVEPIANLLKEKYEILFSKRGLDHGVWVPFLHMWPKADIPILQMTLPYSLSNQELLDLGKKLSPLREQDILITANGTLTHNLREWNPHHTGTTEEWALEFDLWTKKALQNNNIDSLLNWEQQAPQAKRNHPTPEHFRPLLIALGAANNDTASFPIEGFDYGIFSKRSVQFG